MDRSNIVLINHQKSDQRKTSNVVCFSEVKIVTWKHHQEIYTVKYFREFKYIGILFWMVYSKYSYGSRIQFNFIYIVSVTILFQSLTHKQASKSG